MCAGGLPVAGVCKQGGLLISVAWCGPQTSISTHFGTAATMLGRWGNQTETGVQNHVSSQCPAVSLPGTRTLIFTTDVLSGWFTGLCVNGTQGPQRGRQEYNLNRETLPVTLSTGGMGGQRLGLLCTGLFC